MALNLQWHEDLHPYIADLNTLPPLSSQEEETLLSRLHLARQGLLAPEQERAAKRRLIEGYLPLVVRIARQRLCLFRRLSLSDLIQEGNIGLLQAVEDYDFTAMQGRFFAYATACIRNAIIRALPRDSLLRVPRCEFWRLAEQGRLRELDRSQPFSLDATNEQDSSLYDVLPAPSRMTPVASNAVRLQVETLLARLTPREQMVLRLFYGLEESDGRRLTRQEIAALLGVVPGTVQGALKRALRKLRTAPQERANQTHGQRMQDAEKQAQRLARRAEQEASLVQAYTRLEAQGLPITMLALAREAQVGTTMANAYLCQCWGTVPQRLERAYAELIPTEAAITVERLAKTARVSERAASDFLHVQRGTTRQARSRQKTVRHS
jgi:RNA polymerase sporulation-specific sigma factor